MSEDESLRPRERDSDWNAFVAGPAPDDPLVESRRDAESDELSRRLAELPASLEPARDLWPEVAARLEPRDRKVVPLTAWRRVRRIASQAASRPMWGQALAAGVGLVVGALLTYLALSGADAGPGVEGDPSTGTGDGRLVASAQAIDEAEVQFLRAKEELWLAVFARRDELSPEAWEMVQQNLRILDGAVEDLRSALGEDPENPELHQRILANQRRSLDLLQEVAAGLSDSV